MSWMDGIGNLLGPQQSGYPVGYGMPVQPATIPSAFSPTGGVSNPLGNAVAINPTAAGGSGILGELGGIDSILGQLLQPQQLNLTPFNPTQPAWPTKDGQQVYGPPTPGVPSSTDDPFYSWADNYMKQAKTWMGEMAERNKLQAAPGAGADWSTNNANYKDMTTSSSDKGKAIIAASQKLGVKAADLAAIIMFESGGNPTIANASGHKGLIQFSKANWAKYVAPLGERGNTFEGQMEAVVKYLQDTGVKSGSSLADMYAAVLTGSVKGNRSAKDSNGTSVNSAANGILLTKQKEAIQKFGLSG